MCFAWKVTKYLREREENSKRFLNSEIRNIDWEEVHGFDYFENMELYL